ncbi:MAG: DUF1848 domain-containing protein [Clostridiales bacterium]|jgi:hypothetical protein|nr:DUF1848 domain-containing protein [Clostridiales bacterium]
MILSVSRRTDVPALYSDRFFDKLKKGEVLIPNPFISGGKTARVRLLPFTIETNILGSVEVSGNIEGIVFWTKNPAPMLGRMDELKGIPYYFQFTLNPYGKEYESNLPSLENRVRTFIELTKFCPVMWRYDPIFLSKSITVDWHLEQFEKLAKRLNGSAKICIINTLIGRHGDAYCPSAADTLKIAEGFVRIGKQYGIEIKSCAEIIDLSCVGVKPAKCIDPEVFERLIGYKVKKSKLKGKSRSGCNCMESIDIGAYDTCTNGCIYYYAKKGAKKSLADNPDGEIYDRKTEQIITTPLKCQQEINLLLDKLILGD